MTVGQQRRLASESAEEREARLEQIRVSQQQRLAHILLNSNTTGVYTSVYVPCTPCSLSESVVREGSVESNHPKLM